MLPSFTAYSATALALSVVSVGLAAFALAHRHRRGAAWAATLFLAVTVWTFGYSMELLPSGPDGKLFWSQVQYLGIPMTPLAWFWLAATHAGSTRSRSWKWLGVTLLLPAVTVLVAWTNGLHGLLWANVEVFERGALSVATFDYGPWFPVHIGYSYLLMAAGTVVILRRVSEGSTFRLQALALLAAALAPWLGNFLHLTRATPLYPLDFTPFSFAFSAIAVCVGLFQFELLQLAPAARDTVVESMQDGVLVIDDRRRIVDSNPAATRLLGAERQALVGAPIQTVFPEAIHLLETSADDATTVCVDLRQDDGNSHCEVSVSSLGGTGIRPTGSLLVLRDVTRQKEAEARIQFLALRDPLTGLPNRDLLSDRLEQALTRRRDGTHFGVLFLDLDDFKRVNDHYGHSAGDDLLKQVADRILDVLRDEDTLGRPRQQDVDGGGTGGEVLARFGGDEFVVLLDGLAKPEEASEPAARILEAVSLPFDIEGTRVSLAASVGIAIYPEDGEDSESLLGAADAAMYEAKRGGGSRYQFFTPSIDEAVRHRIEIEDELHRALDHDEFELHFQPQVDATTLRPVALEALLRWNHPDRGLLRPGAFLPVAETSSLILSIDAFVIDAACREWKSAFGDRSDAPHLCLNVSPRRFGHRDLAGVITDAVARHGIPPSKLEIELTENALMEDTEATRGVLTALRELGVRIAIDDFGTGFSSLGYLMSFDLDLLKVDRGFVAEVGKNQRAERLVEAVVALGHSLGLEVIGEGVETVRQRDFMVRAGCDRMQGYLFGWPAAAEALMARDDLFEKMSPAASNERRSG